MSNELGRFVPPNAAVGLVADSKTRIVASVEPVEHSPFASSPLSKRWFRLNKTSATDRFLCEMERGEKSSLKRRIRWDKTVCTPTVKRPICRKTTVLRRRELTGQMEEQSLASHACILVSLKFNERSTR